MKYKIISDLHLGIKGNVSNNFLLNDTVFKKYLTDSLSECDGVILLGDIFELWEDLLETSGSTLSIRITNRLKEIINSWCFGPLLVEHNERLHLISGNHDAVIKNNTYFPDIKIVDHMVISENGFNIYLAHGHQGDVYCSEKSIFSCCVCGASQIKSSLEDLVDENLDSEVDKLQTCLGTSDKKITNYAFKVANAGNYNCVVFGHTHHQMMSEKKGVIYVNDGCVCDKTEQICECIINIADQVTVDNRIINIADGSIIHSEMRSIFK